MDGIEWYFTSGLDPRYVGSREGCIVKTEEELVGVLSFGF